MICKWHDISNKCFVIVCIITINYCPYLSDGYASFLPKRTYAGLSRLRLPMADTVSPNDNVISPFDENDGQNNEGSSVLDGEKLDLTWENVDMVLDEMRPYLMQDGGNVAIQAIDGPVVRLELQGACGTCPSSTMTMKMGLERGLKERIPEIQEVVQGAPDGPELNIEQVEVVLNGVRPFLNIAGGTIECTDIYGVEGIQPCISLYMTGNAASLKSVKMEIVQRLQRHFMIPMLRIEWDEDDDDDDW